MENYVSFECYESYGDPNDYYGCYDNVKNDFVRVVPKYKTVTHKCNYCGKTMHIHYQHIQEKYLKICSSCRTELIRRINI